MTPYVGSQKTNHTHEDFERADMNCLACRKRLIRTFHKKHLAEAEAFNISCLVCDQRRGEAREPSKVGGRLTKKERRAAKARLKELRAEAKKTGGEKTMTPWSPAKVSDDEANMAFIMMLSVRDPVFLEPMARTLRHWLDDKMSALRDAVREEEKVNEPTPAPAILLPPAPETVTNLPFGKRLGPEHTHGTRFRYVSSCPACYVEVRGKPEPQQRALSLVSDPTIAEAAMEGNRQITLIGIADSEFDEDPLMNFKAMACGHIWIGRLTDNALWCPRCKSKRTGGLHGWRIRNMEDPDVKAFLEFEKAARTS